LKLACLAVVGLGSLLLERESEEVSMPHECYVATKVSSARLKEALETRAGTFTDEKVAKTIDSDGNYIGEHRGASYVFDGEMLLAMGSSPDSLPTSPGR